LTISNASRGTLIHATTGAPETALHVRQWQIMLPSGSPAMA
jgi:hypothetical protein